MPQLRPTPGPWEVYGATQIAKFGDDWACIAGVHRLRPKSGNSSAHVELAGLNDPDFHEQCANARLIAAAPDHALLARLFAMQLIRWEPFGNGTDGELCFAGLRYSTSLDEFGVPRLIDVLRNRVADLETRR